MPPSNDNIRRVYSTEEGLIEPVDKKKRKQKKQTPTLKNDGIIRVQREKKGRKGKTVMVIYGLPVSESNLQELASSLKRRIGTGGSVKDGTIEIQGDHVDIIIAELKDRNFEAKISGG